MSEPARDSNAPPSLARAAVRNGSSLSCALDPIGSPESIGGMLARNAERFADHVVFQEKHGGRFLGVTWEDFLCDVVAFGRFLSARGIGRGDRIVVISPNRGEMLIAELAAMCLGAIHVPIFPGYAASQTRALIEHCWPSVIVVADRQQLERAWAPPSVRTIVSFEPVARATVDDVLVGYHGEFVTLKSALRRYAVPDGEDLLVKTFLWSASRITPSEPCLMMYTSGTAGQQKGVLLTHDNVLSQRRAIAPLWDIGPEDRFLSYLPWHHSFGGIFEKYLALYSGATLILDDSFGKDFPLLLRNWKETRPTAFFSVPKVYLDLVGHVQCHQDDERVVFHPGLKFVFTAAAPLPARVSEYFAGLGIPVIEGWGLTETSPCCTLTDLAEPRTIPGMVGYPIPGVQLQLATDGEILVRGPNVMAGYYGDPEGTLAALPGDGWFHTGDLGEIVGSGLRLVARKDRVFKMLNAEKIVPTELENKLAGMNRYIRHAVIVGDGRRFLAALVFPDYFVIAEQFGDDRATAERVVTESLRETVLQFNREHTVKYERLHAVAVVSKELSIEDHELTPSMKVRVRNVLKNSEEYLEAIYEPSGDCDCRFLRKVLRLEPDERRCFLGEDRTISDCHACGSFVFGQD